MARVSVRDTAGSRQSGGYIYPSLKAGASKEIRLGGFGSGLDEGDVTEGASLLGPEADRESRSTSVVT